jgi:hypothetical protein
LLTAFCRFSAVTITSGISSEAGATDGTLEVEVCAVSPDCPATVCCAYANELHRSALTPVPANRQLLKSKARTFIVMIAP